MSDILCVTNRALCAEDFLLRVEKIAAARPGGIILREKDLSEGEYKALARQVMAMDDTVDELFDVVKNELISLIRADASAGSQALDLLMIAKYYERIGDHAQNTAEWVEYALTGQHKGVTLA